MGSFNLDYAMVTVISKYTISKSYMVKHCFCVLTTRSVGRPKHVRVMAGALEGDIFIGPTAQVLL